MAKRTKRDEPNCIVVDSLKSLGNDTESVIKALSDMGTKRQDLISFAEGIDTKRDGRDFLKSIELLSKGLGLTVGTTQPSPAETSNKTTKRGRPKADKTAKAKAKETLDAGISIADIVKTTGLSRATIYRVAKETPVPDT